MNHQKDELIQLIVNKTQQWKSYEYVDATNGLDASEYRRRLEKIIQYPATSNVSGYVETIMGEIGTINPTPKQIANIVSLKEFYLQGIRENHTENYLRDIYLLGFGIKNAKVIQFSKDVYLSKGNRQIETKLTPVVHLSNIGNRPLEEPVIDNEKLNHLTSDVEIPYTPTPADIPESEERLIHLVREEFDDEPTELIVGVEKTISEQKTIDTFLEPVYQEPKEELYQPKLADETPVENIESPVKKVDLDNEKAVQKIKDKKLTEHLREKILASSVSDPAKTRLPGGRVLQPLDHWRGQLIKDLKTYHPSKLIEYRDGEWVEVQEGDPVKGLRRRQYDYDGNSPDPNYQYLNSAESAARTITGDTGNKGDYEPPHRGTVDDLFDSKDNAYIDNKGEGEYQSDGQQKFQGSHTPIFLENDLIEKRRIAKEDDGLLRIEKERYNLKNFNKNPEELTDSVPERPLSALDPFTRVSTRGLDLVHIPQHANAFSYNRTRIPIAEIEWRKGFRYLFITRPECYIMTTGNVLSSQCMNDETFYTSWCRLPHISYLLSPSYITCTDKSNWTYRDNFNYLLTNRVMNMTTSGTEMEQLQSIQKATNGATVTPGTTINNDFSGNLSLTFRDTKDLEVYECLRLWMRYIAKIYNGTFASSFNHYSYYNTYGDLLTSDATKGSNNNYGTMNKIHPYDRALDYCATIFDIVTNESGTKIVYWCKYIGVYPMSASQTGLTDNLNKALDNEQTVSARFYYQGREEYKMKSLVEFNYNAGLLNSLGKPDSGTKWVVSHPYLVRQSTNPDRIGYVSPRSMKMDYIGAAGMFTGRPYCVLRRGQNRLMPNGLVRDTITPQLRFMTLQNETLNRYMNGNIVNEENTTPSLVRIT